jgi:hypothetical protein
MDRVTQRHKKGNRLIGQRYLLQNQISSNSVGTLYQATDMRAPEGTQAQVLIHLLSPNAIRSTPLKLMTERLQALGLKTEGVILNVVDSAWFASDPYFVLTSPATWSLSTLPPLLGQATRLHEQALRLNQQLLEQHLIQTPLPSSAFLVSAEGEVYLPSTALAPSLQNTTDEADVLLAAQFNPKRSTKKLWPWLGGGFIGVVAASSAGLYYQNHYNFSQQIRQASLAAATNTVLVEPHTLAELPLAMGALPHASLADTPIVPDEATTPPTKSANPTLVASPIAEPLVQAEEPIGSAELNKAQALVSTKEFSLDPEPGDMRVALAREPTPASLGPEAKSIEHSNNKPMKDIKIEPDTRQAVSNKATAKAERKPLPPPPTDDDYLEEADPEVNLPSPRSRLIRPQVANLRPSEQFNVQTASTALAVVPAPRPAVVAESAPVLGVVNPVLETPVVNVPVAPPATGKVVSSKPAVETSGVAAPVTTPATRRMTSSLSERSPDDLTANGMTSEELVRRAYQALQAGRLDEQANQGAIYFIRLLDRIDHGNPQIIRLARETGYQLQQQARSALTLGDSKQASQKLWRSARLIKEFNLTHLNPAQELLEHKLAE